MKKTLLIIVVLVIISFTSVVVAEERVINKQDADHIFSLMKPQWEAYVQKIVYPKGWKSQLSAHDSGTSVMAHDAKSSFGLLIQPLYNSETSPPVMLIVGSYSPLGTLPKFTDELKRNIEADAKKDLGVEYEITAKYADTPPFEGIELMVTRILTE